MRRRLLATSRLGFVTVLLLLLGVFGSCWGVEPWMRPDLTRRWPDGLWLPIASTGGLGLVAVAACGRGGTRRWLRVLAASTVVVLLLGWTRWCGGRVALDRLCNDEMLQAETKKESPSMLGRLAQWLRDKGYNVPDELEKFTHADRIEPPPLWHLLECSRWPLRRAFIDHVMPQAQAARFLAGAWHRFFPAVVGPDVDLRHRHELLEILNRIRNNKKLSGESRQAATLWMGLVFLTDPPEFDAWRVPLRDAMLGCTNPLHGNRGDYWMRVLDALLAFDPPRQWSQLTAPLAADASLLRRAVRERVRGMPGHLEAIVNEVKTSEHKDDWHAAFALWLDTGRLLAAYPAAPGAETVLAWRRATMFRWLMDADLGGLDESLEANGKFLVLPREPALGMAPDQAEALAAVAFAAAGRAVTLCAGDTSDATIKTEAHRCVEHVRILHPFLTIEQQAELIRRIAPVLVRLPLFMNESTGNKVHRFWLCPQCTRFLADVWPLVPPDARKDFGANFRVVWQQLKPPAYLLCLDAWSGSSRLSDEELLLSAWVLSDFEYTRFKPCGSGTTPSLINPREPLPIPVPQVAAVQALTRHIAAAVAATEVKSFHGATERRDAFMQSLKHANGQQALPDWMFDAFSRWTNQFRKVPIRSSERIDTETLIAMYLCFSGLLTADSDMRNLLTKIATEDGRAGYKTRGLTDHWQKILAAPDQASTAVVDCLDDDFDALREMLDSTMTTPPPAPVVRSMWDALRAVTRHEADERKTGAFGALFRLSSMVAREDRLAMREDFLRFFEASPIPFREWPTSAMEPIKGVSSLRDGEGIPWETDRLAAALSWSSEIKRETLVRPSGGVAESFTGVFSYLAQAFVSFYDDDRYDCIGMDPIYPVLTKPTRLEEWRRQPLQLPLEPTPWQRARALHRDHPELPWPVRTTYRPDRKSTR